MEPRVRGWAAVFLVAVLASSTACAGRRVRASIDWKAGFTVRGHLDFDVAGGPVEGTLSLGRLRFDSKAPLALAVGGSAPAQIDAELKFTGGHVGSGTSMSGTVEMVGRFKRLDTSCEGSVKGTGTWTAQVSALVGFVRIEARWDKLAYDGCGALANDRFWIALPPLRFGGLLDGALGSVPSSVTATGVVSGTVSGVSLPEPTATPPGSHSPGARMHAVLDWKDGMMRGEMDFDRRSGFADGRVVIHKVSYDPRAPLRLPAGGSAPAQLDAEVRLIGVPTGDHGDALSGRAELTGRFTRLDHGCSGTVRGSGLWTADVDIVMGMVRFEAQWDEVSYQGCGVQPADSFWIAFPPMLFGPALEGSLGSQRRPGGR